MAQHSSIRESLLILVRLAFFISGGLSGQEVDFATEVAPILEKKCLSCHNPNLVKGEFSMATLQDILTADEDYLKPGNSADSTLYWITLPLEEGEPPEMPKEGDPLTEYESELLAAWIDAGAEWPDGLILKEASKGDKSWWAYQPISEPKLESIDAYIAAELQKKGLSMNPPADRRNLIRRATYDLTGLPPSPEEVEAFVNDPDPQAYEKLIDRLLASKHYGERWGRHWLDVVRFAESGGYEHNFFVYDLWPFRDYVIRSLNEDKPFDVFIREHIAGDVFGRGNPDIEIGAAFLTAGPFERAPNQEPAQAAQTRANHLNEMISATGEVFLGMTLGCARCHDHKFDPVSQEDYYGLYATFAGIRHGSVSWATQEAKQARADLLRPLEKRLSDLELELVALQDTVLQRSRENIANFEKHWTRPPVDRRGTVERFNPLEAKFVRFVCESQDLNLFSNKGHKIDEIEVWSAENNPRNVALSTNGGKATGESRVSEELPGLYVARQAIDGDYDSQYYADGPALTIELAEPAIVDRVVFSSARRGGVPGHTKYLFVAEYRIEVSLDGQSWQEVAHGRDRKPVPKKYANPNAAVQPEFMSHLDFRLTRLGQTEEEKQTEKDIRREIKQLKEKIESIEPLPTAFLGTRLSQDAQGPFNIFIGGSPQRRGYEVVPASLSTLDRAMPTYRLAGNVDESQRRLALAKWLTDPENPLTPRVLANRIWQYHFGIGIVDTPNDFGYMGGEPTHPELLDFLASKLIENNWQLKAMHKLLMLSETYRQSSAWNTNSAKVDADSRLLWRFPPRRLSAEEIRDTFLSLSGQLDTTMGGPGFRLYDFMLDTVTTYIPLDNHGPETYRRAIYHHNARASVVDLMTDFDQPDCTLSAPRRTQTTTPLQALTMMNHSFTRDMADHFALRVRKQVPEDLDKQVQAAFQIAYHRQPDEGELKQSLKVVKDHGLRALCRAILNSSELIHVN